MQHFIKVKSNFTKEISVSIGIQVSASVQYHSMSSQMRLLRRQKVLVEDIEWGTKRGKIVRR